MKYFLLIFLFIPVLLFADNPRLPGGQESETDSLEQLLQNWQGIDRYEPLMQLTKQYLYREPEKAFRYAIEAATIAGDEGKLPELYEAKEYVGISKIISGKFDTALIIFSQLLQNYTDLGDEARVGKIHNMLGVTRQNMEEHDQALNHYFASLEINEKMNNRMGMANNFNNIGSMYYELGNYPQALIYFKKALAVYEEKNSDGSMLGTVGDISKPVGNISMIYKATEKYDSALIFAEKALVLNREAGNDYGVAGTLNNIGYIYDGMKKYTKAIDAYK